MSTSDSANSSNVASNMSKDFTVIGEYFDRVNDGEWRKTGNLVVKEGIAHILNVAMGTTPKPSAYYIALFSASVQPQPSWTGASFASTASEITSLTEGYDNAKRPKWVPVNTDSNSIDNMQTVAEVVIKTASQLTVQGAALLTGDTRGGTTDVLISAAKFAAPRVFQDGDRYQIGYRLSITV